MISNPEFRRNLWLELTPYRLISMPLVLGAYFFLLFVLGGHQLDHADGKQALFFAGVLALLWGTHMTTESLLSELRDNTWDAQRMSAMPAWRLVWGKLLGSSVFAWYGAVICLAIFVIASEFSLAHILKVVLIFILAALLAQAAGMLMALLSIRKSHTPGRSHSLLFTLVSAFVATTFVTSSLNDSATLEWYGQQYYSVDFSLGSLLAWLAWGWFGCYQLMRAELQMPNRIWPWLSFILWLLVFTSGFVESSMLTVTLPYLALCLTMILSYLMLFSESKNPVAMARLLSCFRQRNWQQIQLLLPCWSLSAILMLLVSLTLPFTSGQHADLAGFPMDMMFDYFTPTLMFTVVLFVIRDVCIVLYLNFSSNRKGADMMAILYLALSYILLPLIFSAMGLDVVNILLLPEVGAGMAGLIVIAAEVGLFFWLMQKRWRDNYGH